MLIQKNVNQNLEVSLYLYYQNLGWKKVDRLWESELEDIYICQLVMTLRVIFGCYLLI
jgi:hypothetical protein